MQNNLNKNEQDAFSENIRQKLENHRLPVDATLWEEIKARLESKKRKVIPFWFWLSGGAAVATLALFFTLQPIHKTYDTFVEVKTTIKQQLPGKRGSIANSQQPKEVHTNTPQSGQGKTFSKTKINLVESTIALNSPSAQPYNNTPIDSNKTNRVNENSVRGNGNKIAENTTEKKDTDSLSKRYIPENLVEKQVDEPIVKIKNKNGWLLATAVGLNGSLPTGNGNYTTAGSNLNIISNADGYPGIMKQNDFSNIIYSTPISVGLILRKNITKTWSLESGLVYTYLLTTFENTVVQQNNAKLHLHYIGVPLNLIAQLWNNPKWEIYLSGGGMMEKGIRSVYVQNQYVNNQTITTTTSTNIEGIQWSVNGAVGLAYKIQQNIGLFFEPKISYYYNNNQPISARTEYPVVFGLSAGVRFKFK
jgi:hypothetical protein